MLEGRINSDEIARLADSDQPGKLDYELLVSDCATTMRSILQLEDSNLKIDFNSLPESDPLRKLLEVTAYRELLARQQINESVMACRIATAEGKDLKRLAGLMSTSLAKEHINDRALRKNIINQYHINHTAGSIGAYKHFAHEAVPSRSIVDIRVESPSTGVVDVCLLFHSSLYLDKSALIPDFIGPQRDEFEYEQKRQSYLELVQNNLAREEIRPIGHHVRVRQASIKKYGVKAKLGLNNQPGAAEVLESARREVWRYITERYRLGATIYRSGILSALHQASVHYILLDELITGAGQSDVGLNPDQAPLCNMIQIEIDNEVPDEKVREANINQVSLAANILSCTLAFKPPKNEIRITHYVVYWGMQNGMKLYGIPPVARLSVGGDKQIRLIEITLHEKANSLVIITANQNGEMDQGFTVVLPSNTELIDDNARNSGFEQ